MRAAGWAAGTVAATTGPVQALAALAIADAMQGRPVTTWCIVMTVATMIRLVAGVWAGRVAAGGRVDEEWRLLDRVLPRLIAAPVARTDVATAAQQRVQAQRLAGEVLGLWAGAALVLLAVSPLVCLWWFLGSAIIVLHLRRTTHPRPLVRRLQGRRRGQESDAALIAAAPLLRDLGLERSHPPEARPSTGSGDAAHGGVVLLLLAGVVQTLVAVWLITAATDGAIGIGAAIAGIIATTTCAARVEHLPGAMYQAVEAVLLERRLRRLPPPADTPVYPTEEAVLVLGARRPLRIAHGSRIALTGSDRSLAALITGLRGQGGWPLLVQTGQRILTPVAAGDHWRHVVAVVAADDRLMPGPIRRNLDPTSVHADDHLLAMLHRLGFQDGAGLLARTIGDDGSGVSVGESQRLLIARALLARPSILVLMDPCRSLDRASAERLWAVLDDTARTLVVVGPDGATADRCQRTVDLEPAQAHEDVA
jgi:ABC-type iron transport system FetAB ATPase subunit